MADDLNISSTGINKQWAQAELTKKLEKPISSITIPVVLADAALPHDLVLGDTEEQLRQVNDELIENLTSQVEQLKDVVRIQNDMIKIYEEQLKMFINAPLDIEKIINTAFKQP